VKVVDTKGDVYRNAAAFISARQEANILQSVRHPHIVELIDIFEKERWLFLVMEYVTGGELFTALSDPRVAVTEGCVAQVGQQLLEALKHLHTQSVVHRDVKAENILLLSDPAVSGSWHIKLIDFGLAMRIERPACFFQMCREQEMPFEELICGTAYYCAPEVWVNDYGPKVDVWAAGVVLYLALLGQFPFYDSDPEALEALICSPDKDPSFRPSCLRENPGYQVSSPAHVCLSNLLIKAADERPDAATALMEPWLQNARGGSPKKRSARTSREQTAPSRTSSVDSELAPGDRPLPLAVRVKAGRAAARPPVEPEKEQSRTAALEALKARAAIAGPFKSGSFSPRRGGFSRRCQSRELEVDGVETMGGGNPILSWVEHDMAPGDTSLTDSDLDDAATVCTCR